MNTPHRPTRLQPADASRRHWLAGLAGVAAATSTWPLGTLAATPAAGQAPRLITVGGAITEVVEVGLPRPRTDEMRYTAGFGALAHRLRDAIGG